MPAESAADRAGFLNTGDFGVAATYTPVGGTAVSLSGILNAPHLSMQLGDGPGTAELDPTFLCRTADLPAGAQGGDAGDRILIGGETYRVLDLQPGGTGMTPMSLGAVL